MDQLLMAEEAAACAASKSANELYATVTKQKRELRDVVATAKLHKIRVAMLNSLIHPEKPSEYGPVLDLSHLRGQLESWLDIANNDPEEQA